MDDNKPDVEEFLAAIAQNESGGGKYKNHKEIKSGLQKGQRAIGTYGLLPNTVDEIVNRSKDPQLAVLGDMDAKEQRAYLAKHPDAERKLAEHLAEHVLTRQNGDPEKAAYAWLNGHNLSPEAIEKRDYQNSDYVQKFNKTYSTMKPETKSQKYTPRPGEPVPPLDMGGTPEGDKVQDYLENYSVKDMMNKHFAEQKENANKALDIATRGMFADKTPDEKAFEEKHLDPLTRGLVGGGPTIGGVQTMGQAAQGLRPMAVNAFNKVKGYLAPKAIQTEDFLAKQAKVPDAMEALQKIRESSNAAIDPLANLTPEQILKLKGN